MGASSASPEVGRGCAADLQSYVGVCPRVTPGGLEMTW